MFRDWTKRPLERLIEPGEKVLYDRLPSSGPMSWSPLQVPGVLVAVIAGLLFFLEMRQEGMGLTYAPIFLLVMLVAWLVAQPFWEHLVLTDQTLLWKPSSLAKVRRLELEEITSVRVHSMRQGYRYLVRTANGRQVKLPLGFESEDIWAALPKDLQVFKIEQGAKSLNWIHWTGVALFAILLCPAFVVPVFLSLAVVECASDRFALVLFVVSMMAGVGGLSFLAFYAALWLALWIWRKRITIEEAKTFFIWELDPKTPTLSSWLNRALLPIGAWILSRTYGQTVRF